MTVPYARANAHTARAEIIKMLQRFGCESVGFMDNFADGSVVLAFRHRGRPVELRASAKGWATMYLKEHPRTPKQDALEQGLRAVNSILRDWIKGQVTAVECGILSFEGVFFAHMLTADGRTVIEVAQERNLLPPPANGDSAA